MKKDEDGHIVYDCENCGREAPVVFYIGSENDKPKWACDFCVTSQKR